MSHCLFDKWCAGSRGSLSHPAAPGPPALRKAAWAPKSQRESECNSSFNALVFAAMMSCCATLTKASPICTLLPPATLRNAAAPSRKHFSTHGDDEASPAAPSSPKRSAAFPTLACHAAVWLAGAVRMTLWKPSPPSFAERNNFLFSGCVRTSWAEQDFELSEQLVIQFRSIRGRDAACAGQEHEVSAGPLL